MHLIILHLSLYSTKWLRPNNIIICLFYIEILMYNFQVYLWTEEPFSVFFQLAKHVGNINSYQNVNGTTKIRS